MYEFQVEKMNCGGCASRVTKAIHGVDSLAKVEIELKSKKVYVESNIDVKTLAAAVIEAGYPVVAGATG
ncbi:heavy-metal-associated domain-containing protein [Noviherbaspirillum autotrophicum]|uniref:Copper-binding protein n=1 Tax=Noviherbaspirillum autotrophicum TaxID=709839 RepID=A0A0C1YSN6_9BURK|nr:heavy-metal-associated domain-containing protein [Noviherbaspirillum autotrophicum]KIF83727.1 copper-binding protein [Noviherbaspirillum autotrophicum]